MYFYVKKEEKGKEREKYFIVNIRFLLNSISSILWIFFRIGIRLKTKVSEIFFRKWILSISEKQDTKCLFSFSFFKFLKTQSFIRVISFRSAYCRTYLSYIFRTHLIGEIQNGNRWFIPLAFILISLSLIRLSVSKREIARNRRQQSNILKPKLLELKGSRNNNTNASKCIHVLSLARKNLSRKRYIE